MAMTVFLNKSNCSYKLNGLQYVTNDIQNVELCIMPLITNAKLIWILLFSL